MSNNNKQLKMKNKKKTTKKSQLKTVVTTMSIPCLTSNDVAIIVNYSFNTKEIPQDFGDYRKSWRLTLKDKALSNLGTPVLQHNILNVNTDLNS